MNLRKLLEQSSNSATMGAANTKPLVPMQKAQVAKMMPQQPTAGATVSPVPMQKAQPVKIMPQQATAKKTEFVPQGRARITKSETPLQKLLRLWR